MSELTATVISLTARESGSIEAWQARALHAIFHNALDRVNPGFATALHESNGRKPFTVSNLIGLRPNKGNRCEVEAGAQYRWRVTTFERTLSDLWMQRGIEALQDVERISELKFSIEGWTSDRSANSWAGCTSYADLALNGTIAGRSPASWINVRFLSPTTFQSNDLNVPLPTPRLVFGHWLDKWNDFAPMTLHPDVRSFAEDRIEVGRYSLRAAPVRLGPRPTVGFTGECSYTIRHNDEYWKRLMHLLAAYSFWCGTGYQTTFGQGQTMPKGSAIDRVGRKERDVKAISPVSGEESDS